MKHLLFAILGALAILAVGVTYSPAADAKIFGGHRATDNHDTCLTPQENLDNKMASGDLNELIFTVDSPDEIAKARHAFVERIGTVDSNIRPFDLIQIFKNKEVFIFDVFNTTNGEQCETTTFPLDNIEFDLWLQAGDLKTIDSSGGHIWLGHDPNKPD